MSFLNQNPNRNNGTMNHQRTTFPPPWLRSNPTPTPHPSSTSYASWTPKICEANTSNMRNNTTMFEQCAPQKQNHFIIPAEARNSRYPQQNCPSHEKTIPIRIETHKHPPQFIRPQPQQQPQLESTQLPWRKERFSPQPSWRAPPSVNEQKMQTTANHPTSTSTTTKVAQSQPQVKTLQPSQMMTRLPPQPTMVKVPPPPQITSKMPPIPPMVAPPPPSMTSAASPELFTRKPMTREKALKLAALKSRPRGRPDWSDMMKEVESGKKLRHVQCNDRSAPILPNMKAKGQFVYESEKKDDNPRNKLLNDIKSGVKLKKVKCNDRSKPNLDGLRKFKREMSFGSMDEQIKKCVSMADVVAAAAEPDELDDIDRVREDLQSAKQMLALELRSKEALEREIKRLLARVANLEAELGKYHHTSENRRGRPTRDDEDEKLLIQLKQHAAEADRTVKDLEHKYHTTAEQLDNMRRKLESAWLRNQELEQQLKSVFQGTPVNQLMRQPSKKFIPITNGGSVDLISDDEETEESDNETKETKIAKELKLLTTKLRTFREKRAASMKERRILRETLKKKQKEMREEKRNYNLLQKETDKLMRLMRNPNAAHYEERQHQYPEEEETESESSEESEEESSDGEMSDNINSEQKLKFLLEHIKRRENRLSSLKKGNDLMQANIERLIDDVNNQREMSLALQEELKHILAALR